MKTIKTILLGILFIAVGTLILLFMMDEVSGKTITVNNDGNEDYITIQDAIDEADDGDTIHVYDGNYTENIVVNKSVNLIGNGTQKTIIWNGDYGFDYAVKITADYVIISNFRITCFGIPPTGDGISVQSNHCKIIGNDCEGINYCINIQSSSNCTIENNSCTIINNLYDRHGIGIYLKESDGCIIQNNTCFSTKTYGPYTYGEGIKLYSSNTCTIKNNMCMANNSEVILSDCNHCIIENNTCLGNSSGLRINKCSSCIVSKNIIELDGIYITGSLENWNSHIITQTNMVNGKPVHYYKNIVGFTVPAGAGQVILANCSLVSVENQNCSNTFCGISVGYSFDISINNNTCSNNEWGIKITNSNDCTIMSNICSDNIAGISLWYSSDSTIWDNTCSANNIGLFYQTGILLHSSSFCTISNNNCSFKNRVGIGLLNSTTCIISNNTCSKNTIAGININTGSENTIIHNTLYFNKWGMKFSGVNGNITIKYNKIFDNYEAGINVTGIEDIINMTHNYWGSDNGPYHQSLNPDGNGNNVSDNIHFRPWLNENGTVNISSMEYPDESTGDHSNRNFSILFGSLLFLLFIGALFWETKVQEVKDEKEITSNYVAVENDETLEKGERGGEGTDIRIGIESNEEPENDDTQQMKAGNPRTNGKDEMDNNDPLGRIGETKKERRINE